MSEHDHNHTYKAHPGSIGEHDHIGHSPGSEYPPGSSHDSKTQYTMMQRLAREEQMGAWEHANEHMEPTILCIEGHDPEVYCSGCRPVHISITGQSPGSEYTPKDEVGTFDIGKQTAANDEMTRGLRSVAETRDRLLETEKIRQDLNKSLDAVNRRLMGDDKGPGFEARLKNMEGKAPMSLLSPIFIEGICEVLRYGSKKYAPNMWRDDPMTFTAELDSIFRHLFAFLRCEDYDAAPPSGSGLLHLFNAACRLMFLTERYFTHPELDDRYPAPGLDEEMFQEEMEKGAEAQYEEPSYDELVVLVKELNAQIQENKNV